MLFSPRAFWFGFSQGFIIGPISLYGIREGLDPRRGFWSQIQVALGATLVDALYLLLSTYGIARFIQHDIVQLILWTAAAYMLITMGVNSLHGRPSRLSFAHLHRHKLRFLDTDFFRAFCMNLVNPMAIVFSVVVFGGLYADYAAELTPFAFALNLTAASLLCSLIIAFVTLGVRHIFHQWMLSKLVKAGSFILVGYGLWFLWKATEHLPNLF